MNPLVRRVMSEIGIDISSQRAKNVAEYRGHVHFGYLITVCDQALANCPIVPGVSRRLHWSLGDPAAAIGSDDERLQMFRNVRDALAAHVDAFIRESQFG